MVENKSSSAKSKKYTLFSHARLDDPNAKPICAFFQTEAGCRNGANCKFSHHFATNKNATFINHLDRRTTLNNLNSSASSISSESSDSTVEEKDSPMGNKSKRNKRKAAEQVSSIHANTVQESDPFLVPVMVDKPKENIRVVEKQKPKKKPRRENKSSGGSNNNDDENPFDLPGHVSSTPTSKQTSKEDHQESSAPADFRVFAANLPISPANPTVGIYQKAKKKEQPSDQADFRSLLSSLPVASFSILQAKDATKSDASGVEDNDEEEAEESNGASPSNIFGRMSHVSPLPINHPDGMKWRDLLIKTRLHPRHANSYSFDKEKELMGGTWIKAKPYGPWCSMSPQAIAVDCEMCETKDPVSGKVDAKALCRLSVVNASNPSEVLLDTLVKPEWPVTDYRSWINGIEKEHLENVQFTLRHAQAFMIALCSEETVILGHALHNDLAALKMEHYCVVDSSFIFPVKDAPDRRTVCSLRDLAKQILQREMPQKHDSVNDARTALEAIEVYRAKNGDVEPIVRTPKNTTRDAEKLLIHRIPKIVNEDHIFNMLLHLTSIKPLSVEKIEFNGNTGKTHAIFTSAAHAHLAFQTLEGVAEMDKSMKLQKKVMLKNKDYIRVRKMNLSRPRKSD